MKNINAQEKIKNTTAQTSCMTNTKKSSHGIDTLLKTKDKEKVLKSARG